jgi:transposase
MQRRIIPTYQNEEQNTEDSRRSRHVLSHRKEATDEWVFRCRRLRWGWGGMPRGPRNVVAAVKRRREKDYPRAVFEHACALLRQRQKQRRGRRLTLDAIAKAVGVASRRTIWKWNRKLLMATSLRLQTRNRGRPSALTTEQRRILAGKVVAEHVQHHDTTTDDVIRWARALFDVKISQQHVSRLGVEFGLTVRFAQSITKAALTTSKRLEALAFLQRHRQRKLPAERIFALDKIGIYLQKQKIRHWAPRGR